MNYGVLGTSGFGGNRTTSHLVDINGDGRADLVWVDAGGNVNAWLNTGTGTDITWVPIGEIASGIGNGGISVTFGDVDGDGRADYLYVNPDGSMDVWLNPDLTGHGSQPGFIHAGQFASPPGGAYGPSNVTLGDMDGSCTVIRRLTQR